jgi:hypothetical protein
MKSIFTLIICFSSLHICLAQATLSYAQTVQSMTNKHLIVYLDTTHLIDVVVTYTDEQNLEIHTNIHCPHGKKAVLEYLKRDGRYDLKIYEHSKFYATVLSMEKEFHYVFINDTEYQENIIYHLSLPKGTTYDIKVPKTGKPKQMPIAVR